MPTAPASKRLGAGVLAVPLLALALLAGCMGTGTADKDNRTPTAEIEANRDSGFTGENFVFRGDRSSDPDGEVVEYRFDFGDGTVMTVKSEEEARVRHAYVRGGEYTVTLTVMDDGKEEAGALSDSDTVDVNVNEKVPVASQVLYAAPLNATETSRTQIPFDVNEGADTFEVELAVTSSLITGASEIKVRVVDPEGDEIDEESVTVPAGDSDELTMSGVLRDEGAHRLIIEARSGGATVEGELRVYYDSSDAAQSGFDE